MATAAKRTSTRPRAVPSKATRSRTASPPVRARASAASAVAAPKEAVAKKPKRIRGDFAMPAADFERIAQLKDLARRAGLNVKKNELLRLGLQALQALPSAELHDRIRDLRIPAKPAKS